MKKLDYKTVNKVAKDLGFKVSYAGALEDYTEIIVSHYNVECVIYPELQIKRFKLKWNRNYPSGKREILRFNSNVSMALLKAEKLAEWLLKEGYKK